ncbi:type II secretion system minor pseudopilin GspI [Coralloluteibacterium thermophilus]|uniref:Type II secretion system protein I n=1 Tax=Coralloluteibacterium thermophilum TaxID=2707049 RepID=A0ABV9NMM5_9GAMM
MSPRRRGFSLLEVLVALLVLALAMAALVRTAAGAAAQLADRRERVIAQWVASNAISEVRLAPGLPARGIRSGEARMAGRDWRWRMTVADTALPGVRRLDVAVTADDGTAPVLVLTGFAGTP